MTRGTNKLTIGLIIDQKSTTWVAGILYVKSIAMALDSVRGQRDFDLHLIIPSGIDMEHVTPFIRLFDRVHFFSPDQPPQPPSIRSRLRNLNPFRKEIASLQETIETNVDVVLPVQIPFRFKCMKPWVSWIPDFQHKRCPQFFGENELQARDLVYTRLIKNSSHMLLNSQDARGDILRFYSTDAKPERLSVYRFCTFPEEHWLSAQTEDVCRKYNLPEKFLMFPSQYWIHKNHLTLFKAIAKLKEDGLDDIALVLTGHDSDYRHPEHADSLRKFIRDHNLGSHIRHLGLLPRFDQVQLIRRAAAIVQPSFFEGWSMLVEDCRALGKKVFLSSIPVHKEQGYASTTFFDPESSDELTQAIKAAWPTLEPGPHQADEKAGSDYVNATNLANGHHIYDALIRITNPERDASSDETI